MRLPLILALTLAVFLVLGILAERHMATTAHEMDALLSQVQGELLRGRNEPALALLAGWSGAGARPRRLGP